MFIAMNRFRIAPGFEESFVQMWRERDSRLQDVPGFRQFNLLRGESRPEATIFISHSTWESRQAFPKAVGVKAEVTTFALTLASRLAALRCWKRCWFTSVRLKACATLTPAISS